MLITSVNNDKIKELVKLKEKKYRDKTNIFFIEGKDLLDEAYKNKVLKDVYVLDGYDNPYNDISCTYITKEVMMKISDMESISPYYGICDKLDEKDIGNKVLYLDDIGDPGNLGTIIRSAVAFKFDTIILSRNTVDLYNPKVIRSTKGMLFNVNIIVSDINELILDDYYVYGTDVRNGVDICSIEIPDKIVIVIGNEGRGISNKVRSYCDKFIYIPMSNKCESLNAGVSAAILMYEVMKK